jgi:hypothetical protein
MDDGHATMMLSVAVALEFESKCLLAEHRIRIIAGLSVKQAEIDVGGLIAKSQSVRLLFVGGRNFAIRAMGWCLRRQ